MQSQHLFTGRMQHRLGDKVHFAEVTVRAEPCVGESDVVLCDDVLTMLRAVFGADFEHQRHCIQSAVSAQISTVNVKGQMPLAGATSFRAEVVEVRISGNAGRDLSGFLLGAAGMDAIGEYLVTWETEQRVRSGGIVDQVAQPPLTSVDLPASTTTAVEPDGLGDTGLVNPFEHMSEHELLGVVYQTCYIMVRSDIESGTTESEIRRQQEAILQASGAHAEAVREALEDALAGRPPRYKGRAEP